MNRVAQDFTGELLGTFLLVFFGTGSVAVSVLFGAHVGLLQVALVWGLAAALAIYATRHLSCAHLNPAVSLAMVVGRRMSPAKLPAYLAGQLTGAFLAAAVIYALFSGSIAQYEALHGIVRGSPASIQTAMMFGEYFPNPGAGPGAVATMGTAFFAEAFGTLLLVFLILSFTEGCNLGRPGDELAPLFIGLSLAIIIAVLAPLTQAGFNPARDLSPRLFSWFAGWGPAAFPGNGWGVILVYVAGPIAGGAAAALLFSFVIEPLLRSKAAAAGCCADKPDARI